jgi:hypothetical protein
MEQTGEMVLVSAARLRELEELATKGQKLTEKQKSTLEELRNYDKTHPNEVKERKNRYISKNREAYNARRRERYRQRANDGRPSDEKSPA